MFLGEILYCRPSDAGCTQYIRLDRDFELPSQQTVAALCIPLEGVYNELKTTFEGEGRNDLCCLGGDCTRAAPALQGCASPKSRWVLNIECLSQDLSRAFAGELLSDPDFSEIIKRMIDTLAIYQKQRDMHRALERSSTLLALATNTLKARSAYRALLREVSTACDGADVTLHLRDLFDGPDGDANSRNRDRCSVFVTGVGKNFRDFLINQRIGLRNGQIGWALDGEGNSDTKVSNSKLDLPPPGEAGPNKVRVQYIVGKEIEDALNDRPHALPYKQLMPNTFLNATVPIYFHDRKIGVINLEWDKDHLLEGLSLLELGDLSENVPTEDRDKIETYLSKRLPLVYRMADYLSLVIDYFDDIEHLAPPPNSAELSRPDFVTRVNRDGALRGFMRYYVDRGMKKADELAKAGIVNTSRAEELCLRDLVDAVGYFLASGTQLRILVSVRRTDKKQTGRVLNHLVSHWLEGLRHEYQDNREKPILVEDMATVLATSAHRGVPLFGTIEERQGAKHLVLDDLWSKWLPNEKNSNGQKLETVPYSPAGPEPRYEIAVPLVFGKRVLGTFDFEQFALEPQSEPDVELDEREICAHLQWGRAITFLIAYLEDAKVGSDKCSSAFRRFQLLCAQLIAEVPVEDKQLTAIAADLFAEIAPVTHVRLETRLPDNTDTSNRLIAQLRFRGSGDHRLSWEWDPSSAALLASKPESEPGKTVTAMMTSYHALVESLKPQELGDGKFLTAMDGILKDLDRNEANLVDVSRDARSSALKVFSFLNDSLHRYLLDPPADSDTPREPSKYAWFLHVHRFDSETGLQTWTCNPDSGALPLAYCYTQEMKDIVDHARRAAEAEREKNQTERTADDFMIVALSQLLKERASELKSYNVAESRLERVINAIKADLSADPTDEDVIRAITARLSRSKSDGNESGEGKKALGFTLSVAKARRPIVVPEINLSPNRSERDHGWFWRYPYTVIGIPFVLGAECLAVLNVFRRRESNSDMDFFRIEERDNAGKLAEKVETLFTKLLAEKQFAFLSNETLLTGLLPLAQELDNRAVEGKKLIIVQSPFARSSESFDVLVQHVFSKTAKSDNLRDPVHLPRDERSCSHRSVVLRISKDLKNDVNKLRQLGPELGSITKYAQRVFLFVSGREDVELESVPAYANHVPFVSVDESLLQRDIKDEEDLYCKWLLGTAMQSLSTKTRLLARRDGPWSHSAFREWVLERGRTAERADLYSASDHLKGRASWRLTKQILLLDHWDGKEIIVHD
jgi:hypothetical protein